MRIPWNIHSLFVKILVVFIALVLIPLLFVNQIWYHNTSRILYENELESSNNLLEQIAVRLENAFNGININTWARCRIKNCSAPFFVFQREAGDREQEEKGRVFHKKGANTQTLGRSQRQMWKTILFFRLRPSFFRTHGFAACRVPASSSTFSGQRQWQEGTIPPGCLLCLA